MQHYVKMTYHCVAGYTHVKKTNVRLLMYPRYTKKYMQYIQEISKISKTYKQHTKRQAAWPKPWAGPCAASGLGRLALGICIYLMFLAYTLDIPQTVLAQLRGSYFCSIIIPLGSRIAGRRPRYLSLGTAGIQDCWSPP